MKTELCTEDVVVHLTTPQMFVTEADSVGAVGAVCLGGAVGTGGGGAAAGRVAAASAAVECGRELLLAARAGNTATVRQLMAKGAPFTTDWLGTSPLHLAAANNHCDTVAVLLRAGVSRDARTKVERTPLHLAAHAGHARVVSALLENGAAPDARDMLRMTPLHWAVERGHLQVARLLVLAGADVTCESKFRKTPLSLAQAQAAAGRTDMIDMINECLAARDVTTSLNSLDNTERMNISSETEPSPEQKIQETPTKAKTIQQPPSTPTSNIKTDPGVGAGGGVGGVGSGGGISAAALFRRHGITLLPRDTGSTVLSALQSGRTVVLSDAGKLMLKESSDGDAATEEPSDAAGVTTGGAEVTVGGAGGAGRGVVLRATPVSAPPPGVRVFTLPSARLIPPAPRAPRPLPPSPRREPDPPVTVAAPTTPVKQTDKQNDVQQVKLVQLGGAAGGRPAVRIIMNRNNYRKLVATATRASNAQGVEDDSEEEECGGEGEGGEGESVVCVPEQFVRSTSPQYLRSQLLCAHAAIQHLARQLHRTRERLKRVETLQE